MPLDMRYESTIAQRMADLLGENGERWSATGWGRDGTRCVMHAFWDVIGRHHGYQPHCWIRDAAEKAFGVSIRRIGNLEGGRSVAYCNDILAKGDYGRIRELLQELHNIELAARAAGEGAWRTSQLRSSAPTP